MLGLERSHTRIPESTGQAYGGLESPFVLAARLADEPRPTWICALLDEGRIWRDRRGWHAGSGGERVDLDPSGYLVKDEDGELRVCPPLTYWNLIKLRDRTIEVDPDDVFVSVTYHEGGTRFATGYVRGWGDLRWRLSADSNGDGCLEVIGVDGGDEVGDGSPGVSAIGTSLDPALVSEAMGADGPATRTEGQREIADIIAEALSHFDPELIRRSLLAELASRQPLPRGQRR